MFDKEALFAALKPKTDVHKLEGFGPLNLRQLSVREVDEIRARIKGNDDPAAFGLALVRHCVIDDEGNSAFTDEDVAKLAQSSNVKMDALVAAALVLNGFKKADEAGN